VPVALLLDAGAPGLLGIGVTRGDAACMKYEAEMAFRTRGVTAALWAVLGAGACCALAGCAGQDESSRLADPSAAGGGARGEPLPAALAGLTPVCGGRIAPDGQLELPGKVEFEFYKAIFRDTSATTTMLQCAADFLTRNPKVTKLDVSVFMDDTGNPENSLHVSEARAQTIIRWLAQHGVQPERLAGRGFGPTHPLFPNDTPEHRLANRRAEFHVAEVDHVAATGAPGASAVATAPAAPTAAIAPVAPRDASPALIAATPQPSAYAVVIGIEKYGAGLPPPTGARSDAERIAKVFQTTLGIANEHIQVLLDDRATKGAIEGSLAWAKASTPAGGRLYFYFSGHGSPDATSGSSYIVPTDGDPRYLEATAISLRDVMTKLGQTKAHEVIAMIDSCFSGAGGRSVLPPGTRPIVRVKEEVAPPQSAVFSASGANEISGPVPGGSGGVFTSFLVQGLGQGEADINGGGQVSLAELVEWVSPRVTRAAKTDNRAQTPSLVTGRGLGPESVILEWGLPAH
jgi:outer membrane protein OmpA-like peptidoglycan-associated protein